MQPNQPTPARQSCAAHRGPRCRHEAKLTCCQRPYLQEPMRRDDRLHGGIRNWARAISGQPVLTVTLKWVGKEGRCLNYLIIRVDTRPATKRSDVDVIQSAWLGPKPTVSAWTGYKGSFKGGFLVLHLSPFVLCKQSVCSPLSNLPSATFLPHSPWLSRSITHLLP